MDFDMEEVKKWLWDQGLVVCDIDSLKIVFGSYGIAVESDPAICTLIFRDAGERIK